MQQKNITKLLLIVGQIEDTYFDCGEQCFQDETIENIHKNLMGVIEEELNNNNKSN